jgi:alkaline phosphatase D
MSQTRHAAAITRRDALKVAAAAGIAATTFNPSLAQAAPSLTFPQGIASGDPLANSVIIWTRAVPDDQRSDFQLVWQVSRQPDMSVHLTGGVVNVAAANDWIVKVDVQGLEPGTTYYYRFYRQDQRSPIGTTRTLPTGDVAKVRLAMFSCANYEKGFFNVYGHAAQRGDIDFVLALGDYIYEYQPGGYVTAAMAAGAVTEPRVDLVLPRKEIVEAGEYRQRYITYKSDPDLQALHAKAPWIVIWDDHETADNAWKDGAHNHQPATEGAWTARKIAAVNAFYNWLPIREPASGIRIDNAGSPTPIYRRFDFGSLARLAMLDTRLIGRDAQFESADEIASPQLYAVYAGMTATGEFPLDVTAAGVSRQILGTAQEAWLADQIATSTQTWQIIGNQMLYQYQPTPDFMNSSILTATEKAQLSGLLDQLFGTGTGAQFAALGAAGAPSPSAQDAWTGYPAAKLRFGRMLAAARNPVVLAGDSHNAWAANLSIATPQGIRPMGVEFGTSSVTSPGYEQTLIGVDPAKLARLLVETSTNRSVLDKLVYCETARRGYVVVELTPAATRAEYVAVNNVFTRSYTATTDAVFQVAAGSKAMTRLA